MKGPLSWSLSRKRTKDQHNAANVKVLGIFVPDGCATDVTAEVEMALSDCAVTATATSVDAIFLCKKGCAMQRTDSGEAVLCQGTFFRPGSLSVLDCLPLVDVAFGHPRLTKR